MKNSSLRGKLIEIVIKYIVDNDIEINEFESLLLISLQNLNFRIDIIGIKINNNILCGDLLFNDEYNDKKIITFHVDYNSKQITNIEIK